MARMPGVERSRAGWLARIVYRVAAKKVGKLTGKAATPEPLTVTAHHPRLLRAVLHMEMGQEAARRVPARLKMLASIKTAMRIGCPF